MGASSEEQFCLRWNDFQQCIKTTFTDLRDESEFMDVTISCDGGEQLKAHKVILSACSVTFRHLLKKNPAQHPVIVLWDVLPRDLAAILDFMYHGEVNVKQDHLNSFLAVAERLRVRGLCQNDGGAPSSKGNKPGTPQVEKPKGRSLEAQATPPPLEPQLKRPRLVAPAADEDEVEELPPPQVKLEEGGTGEYKSSGGTRPPTSHYTEQQQQQYAMAEAGAYDESAHGSEYGDYSGYDEEMGYMEGGGVDPTQGSKDHLCCYECDKTFKAVSSYRRHIRDYHGDANTQHQCEYCEKVFRTKGLLINHKSAEHRQETQAMYIMNQP